MATAEITRFDVSLTKEQKEFFEYAARLSGCKDVAEFIISSAQKEAERVIERNGLMIFRSKQDRRVFFDALTNPPKPNARLRSALSRYYKFTNENAG